MVGKRRTPELYSQSFHRFIFIFRVLPSCQAGLKFIVAHTLLSQISSPHHQPSLDVNFEARLGSFPRLRGATSSGWGFTDTRPDNQEPGRFRPAA